MSPVQSIQVELSFLIQNFNVNRLASWTSIELFSGQLIFRWIQVRLTIRKYKLSNSLSVEKLGSSKSTAPKSICGTLKISTLENCYECFDFGSSLHYFCPIWSVLIDAFLHLELCTSYLSNLSFDFTKWYKRYNEVHRHQTPNWINNWFHLHRLLP